MATVERPKLAKDILFLAPDELVVNRKWNGRWTAVVDESVHDDTRRLSESQMVSIRELAHSIAEHDQLEDVLIRQDAPDKQGRIYHVVAGFSRTRAIALLAKEDPNKGYKVRCRLLPKGSVKDDKEAFILNEEENRQRNNLTLLDKAYCMQRERDDLGYAAAQIAKRWGCSVPAVAQALSLVTAPQEVQQAVHDKLISATDVIDTMKNVPDNGKIEIVNIALEAKAKGTPLRSSHIKELARARTVAPKPEPAPAAPAADGTTPAAEGQGASTGTNGATAPAPTPRRGRGRPASPDKLVPRAVADFRADMNGREDVLSQALLRYFAGHKDMDGKVLCGLIDQYVYPDGQKPEPAMAPRTEGAEAESETPAE